MESRNGAAPCPPLLDFERASLAWMTRDGSRGRWRLIASAAQWSPQAGVHQLFVLAPRILAGDVYGTGMLPRDPCYGFQIAASSERHLIMRDFARGQPSGDTADRNAHVFADFAIDAPPWECLRLDPDLIAHGSALRAWPLAARLRVKGADVEHLIDFPVLHVNTKQADQRVAFQVETGPVLVPASLIEGCDLSGSGFALAYVFFNRLDRVDLAICAAAGSTRAGIHFARLEKAVIEMFCAAC
jgi:hypothetical protein